MDKQILLRKTAAEFRELLRKASVSDSRFVSVVERLEPMFADIEAGKIVAPVSRTSDSYSSMFHPESTYLPYQQDTALSLAESSFMSALEDWPSQKSYQEMLARWEFRQKNPGQIPPEEVRDRQILGLAPLPGTPSDSPPQLLQKVVNKLRAWLGG